jgi:hypothetical protein
MTSTVKGIIRRIAYNPFPASSLNQSSTVVVYLEDDVTKYLIGSIAKGYAEAVLLSKPGDFIEAQLRKSEYRFATGLLVETWINRSFEMEQAALTNVAPEARAPVEAMHGSSSAPADTPSVLHSEVFSGIRYCFTSDSELDRARQVYLRTALDISNFEDELDNSGIKWSIKTPTAS